MYDYTDFDEAFVRTRVAQFTDQVERRLDGSLTEDEFRPLRLMNGLYLQLHAYMLRVAIPYGTINPRQMRQLAYIADTWDKGYGHFTTRQNIQFNWPKLPDVPAILSALADVGMHAIQTSGNCVRNVTADHFAGAAADEIEDPRPYAELLRQWSTDHPEFQFLPRKFKIAITGSPNDRAVTAAHDIGLRMTRNAAGEAGFEVFVGGGLGRTPMIGHLVRQFLPVGDLLPYVESVLSVYNTLGRRDNKYKARIKITVHETGRDEIARMIEARFAEVRPLFGGADQALLADIRAAFAQPALTITSLCPIHARRARDRALATQGSSLLRRDLRLQCSDVLIGDERAIAWPRAGGEAMHVGRLAMGQRVARRGSQPRRFCAQHEIPELHIVCLVFNLVICIEVLHGTNMFMKR
jgi:sulfite reductase (NADPH) hemoprotein beta-component